MSEVSPRVIDDGWGFIEIEGLGRFRDAKLWPGGGRAWDWRETGTDHRPGILSADVTELLDHEPDLGSSAAAATADLKFRQKRCRCSKHVKCRSYARRPTPRWRRTTAWLRNVAESQASFTRPADYIKTRLPARLNSRGRCSPDSVSGA